MSDGDLFDDNDESNDIRGFGNNEMHQMPDGSWVTEMKDWAGNTVYVDSDGGVLTSLTDVTGNTVLTDDDGRVVVTERQDFAGNDMLIDSAGNQVTELEGAGPVNYSGDTANFGVESQSSSGGQSSGGGQTYVSGGYESGSGVTGGVRPSWWGCILVAVAVVCVMAYCIAGTMFWYLGG